MTEPDPQQDSFNSLEDTEEREGRDLHQAPSTGDQAALDAMAGGDGGPEDAVEQRHPATATRDQDDTDRNR